MELAIVPFSLGWRGGRLSRLTYGPPMRDPVYGHLYQAAALNRLAVHHLLFYAYVVKSSITRRSV